MLQANTKLLNTIPLIGFGTWDIRGKSCVESVRDALDVGYRHIDTAQMYGNEKEVGKGVRESEVDRESVFVTTKIAANNLKPNLIRKTFASSLLKLNMEYVDLLLIHWPNPGMDLKACLETMFSLKEEKKVRHIGVSNFSPDLFHKAIDMGEVITNQIKFTPFNPQFDNLKLAKNHKKIITAYSPLERGNIVKDQVLRQIGEIYNKTVAQISLRWLIQLGNISVIPKAQRAEHRKDNLDIFDFELTETDMKKIMEREKIA